MPPHTRADTVRALVEALSDDPFYRSITVDFATDPARRDAVLGQYFDYSMAEAERIGVCAVLPGCAAIWSLPMPAARRGAEAAAKERHLATVLGPQGIQNYHRIVSFMAPLAEPLAPADAWYLSIVGVAAASQNQGLGARLLTPTLALAREAGAACYLETFTPRNLPFYERLGFRVVGTFREPTTGSTYDVMRRDAA